MDFRDGKHVSYRITESACEVGQGSALPDKQEGTRVTAAVACAGACRPIR